MLQTKQEIIFLIVAVILILIVVAVLFIFSIIYFKNRNQKIAKEKEQLRKEFEAQILKTQLEIQEQTSKVISKELHDNVGHILTIARQHTAIAVKNQPINTNNILIIDECIEKTIAIVRNVARSLDTDLLIEQPLSATFGREVERLQKIENINFEYNLDGREVPIGGTQKIMVYRILQEATNNILKYAKASKVTIDLFFETNYATVTIVDNGVGFNSQTVKEGMGLQNIYKRMKLINGNATITSIINTGTTIELQVPYAEIVL